MEARDVCSSIGLVSLIHLVPLLGACAAPDWEGGNERLAHGEVLYRVHCAVCHGSTGRGDGEAARYLFPPARDFGQGRFRLVTTLRGAPSEADLVATLHRGIPGSAMPAWSWLADEDLGALANYVRFLAEVGIVEKVEAHATQLGEPFDREQAEHAARELLLADAAQPKPLALPTDPDALKRGQALFVLHCADCHGRDGSGQREPRWNEDGSLNWARDLRAGLLKGDESPYALACRIRTGMPGSAMPGIRLAPDQEADLLAYLTNLIPDEASARYVHRRGTLRALRVDRVPSDGEDGAWEVAEELRVVLAPLWWNTSAVFSARLSALHDGERLAVRIRWPDSSGELRLFSDANASDAVALQFSPARRPALFGMGAPDNPTNLWHWQALRVEDVAGALELLAPRPHAGVPGQPIDVRADVPTYQRLLAELRPSDRADRITVEGVQTMSGAHRVAGEVVASAHWEPDAWCVTFTRPLRPSDAGEIEFQPGQALQIASAVWNGAIGDQGAHKSISIWQHLVLDP